MKRFLCGLALGVLLLASPAGAASLNYFGPGTDPSNQIANLNTLIASINAIVTPLLPTVPGSVNSIVLTPAVTGGTATIAPGGAGSDANAALGLSGAGNGNVVLFAGNPSSSGVLQFANAVSYVPARAFGACPGAMPNAATTGLANGIGPHANIHGFIAMQDWLGRTRYVPAC